MQGCLEKFTVTVGTVFERSKVPLNKWLLATYLLSSCKKGMSAHQLHRMLGVTYKTAWFMMHRIREAMKQDIPRRSAAKDKTVEVDETFVGGKASATGERKVADRKNRPHAGGARRHGPFVPASPTSRQHFRPMRSSPAFTARRT